MFACAFADTKLETAVPRLPSLPFWLNVMASATELGKAAGFCISTASGLKRVAGLSVDEGDGVVTIATVAGAD